MKLSVVSLFFALAFLVPARGDLTIVQQVDGLEGVKTMTIKIKGDKARVDATPQITTILDTKTGDITTLMNDQKRAMHLTAKRAKAMADMAKKYARNKESNSGKPKLVATGKTQTINGYAAQEYTVHDGHFDGSFWIVPNYPGYDTIRKEMEKMKSNALSSSDGQSFDYSALPGMPVRTTIKVPGQGDVTNTVTSVSQDPIPDGQFIVPKDFFEMKMPEFDMGPPASAGKPSPVPNE